MRRKWQAQMHKLSTDKTRVTRQLVWVQRGKLYSTQTRVESVRQLWEPWESAAVRAPSLTCSLWNLSASVQRRLRAPPHTERTACRWGCSSGSCQRFWSRRPQTLWACGNVVFANEFPSWRSLQRTEKYVHSIFCITIYYEIKQYGLFHQLRDIHK